MLGGLLRLIRPRQWVKNVLVVGAPVAGGVVFDPDVRWRAVGAFVVFCAVASAVYVVNDIVDRGADRLHPVKRDRPVASGAVSVWAAGAVGVVLGTAGFMGAWTLSPASSFLVVAYVANAVVYSIWLKHVAVFDLLSVASGFVVRAGFGAVVTGVMISQWFLTVLAFGSLAMAAGKRSSELRLVGDSSEMTRRVLGAYTPGFLLQVEAIAVGGALVGYSLWAFDLADGAAGSLWLQLSVVPFAAALLRYLLAVSHGAAEAPERAVFADRLLGVSGVVWASLFMVGVWL